MKTSLAVIALIFLISGKAFSQTSTNADTTPAAPAPATSPSGAKSSAPLMLEPIVVTGAVLVPAKGDLSSDVASDPVTTAVVTQADIKKIPIVSYGDIYRSIPGFDVVNYGQGGLGYGISLRGWDDSEHGHDIATFIDGMPINEVSSPQVNGYTDLNPLIPELVKGLEVTYGPFNPRFGNFALAGSASFTTFDSPASGVYLSGGSFDTAREFVVYNFSNDKVDAYTALESDTTGGYRDNEDAQRINSFSKVTFPMLTGVGSLRFQFFSSNWDSPGYINRSLVQSGALSPTAAVNPTDGGNKTEENGSFNFNQGTADDSFTFNAYVIHDLFRRYRDRDTLPDSPTNPPDQGMQADNRTTTGFNAEKYWEFTLPNSMTADLMVGTGIQFDFVQANEYDTLNREPVDETLDETFNQYNPYVYAQADLKPLPWLKLTAATRFDNFYYDIDDKTSGLIASPDTGAASPKGGIVITPIEEITLFASIGKGIRAPSVIDDLDPNPDEKVATSRTEEVGVQYKDKAGLYNLSGDVYDTYVSNELEDNDVTAPINLGKSERQGFAVDARVVVFQEQGQSLTFVSDFSMVRAHLLDEPQDPDYIPNVPAWLFTYGLDYQVPLFSEKSPNLLTFSFRHQFTGPKFLSTDGQDYTNTYSRISTKIAYTRTDWHNFTAFVGIIAYPDDRLDETAFVLGGGVVGTSPQAPVTVNCGVSANF
jgi:outer membrane receptor protein involved in Fe transport